MAKLLIQLDQESRERLSELPETGMGYFIVRGSLGYRKRDQVHIIAGDFVVAPLSHPDYFCLADLLEGQPMPEKIDEVLGMGEMRPASLTDEDVSLPPAYLPDQGPWGAFELIGSTTLKHDTNFYRFTGAPRDPRYVGGSLRKDTYLTTTNDQGYANTGFAAVGRYALPLPVPAHQVHIYTLQKGTPLLVGTAVPKYGQAGGGVEVKLPADTPAAHLRTEQRDIF
jgi:hypothetical protein